MAEPTYQLYNTAYFSTHSGLLDQSIKLAEKEFVTLADRIQLLEGKIADYERAIATGTSMGKGGLKVSESEVTGRLRLQETRRAKQAKELSDIQKSAEKSFDISRFNMPDVRNSIEAQIRGGATVTKAVDGAISNIGGKGSGKDLMQRYVLAKSILQSAKSAATAQGKRFTDSQLRTQIAAGMGLDANTMLLADQKILEEVTKPKKDAVNQKYAQMDRDNPIPGIAATAGDKERMESEKSQAEEKLKVLEQQMKDQYGDTVDLGKIIERGREIYSQQYAPLTRNQRRELRKMKTVDNLSPTARTNYNAYTSVKDSAKLMSIVNNLYGEELNEDTIAKTARQIIAAKEQGRDTDVRKLARDSTDSEQDAEQALGIAMHYYVQNVKTGLIPNLEKMAKKVEESDEKAALDEAAKEQGVSADAIKRTAKVKGIDMSGFDDLFSNRISGGKEVIRTQEDTSVVEIPDDSKTRRTKQFEELMATRPPSQAVLLRQLADKVGGVDAFMIQYEDMKSKEPEIDDKFPRLQESFPSLGLKNPPIITTEMMLNEIKPPAPFDFSNRESKTLEELVEGATGITPQPTQPSEMQKTLEQKATEAGVAQPTGPSLFKAGDLKNYPGFKSGYKIKTLNPDGSIKDYIYVGTDGQELPSVKINEEMRKDADGLFGVNE